VYEGARFAWFGVFPSEKQGGELGLFREDSRYGTVRYSVELNTLLSKYRVQALLPQSETIPALLDSLYFYIVGTRKYKKVCNCLVFFN
jgi:hypothetical protein